MARKYVMLSDNPAPVKVNRPDAATPTPISYTDALQDGKAIDYKTQDVIIYNPINQTMDRYMAIIDSYKEFKEIYESEKKGIQVDSERYIELYDENYFKENVLIMLFVTDGCADSKQEVKSITQTDGQLCIYLKNTHIGVLHTVGFFRKFIEISKKEMNSVDTVVVYEEKKPYTQDNKVYYIQESIYRDSTVLV